MTQEMIFEEIKAIVERVEEVENREEIMTFIDKKIEQIHTKAAKAKEKAAEKKNTVDAIYTATMDALTGELQTVDAITEIVAASGIEGVTRAKIVNRLAKMYDAELVVRDDIKVEGRKGKVKAYALASGDSEVE